MTKALSDILSYPEEFIDPNHRQHIGSDNCEGRFQTRVNHIILIEYFGFIEGHQKNLEFGKFIGNFKIHCSQC